MVAGEPRDDNIMKTIEQDWTVVNAPTAKPRWTDGLITGTQLITFHSEHS